jgi:tRNA-modifying protein YgfZ
MFSLDQYRAAIEHAALIDRSTRGKISLTGADRASFLHALLTNDIARLTPGTGAYAAYLTPQGRMISDMRVVECGDEILLDVESSVGDALSERLDTLIFSEDVQVKNVTRDLAEMGVHGPLASRVLADVLGIAAARLDEMNQYDTIRVPASTATVVRDDALGVVGFDVYAPAADAARVIAAIVGAGAVPAGEETAEVLRIEAGRPRFTVDMDTDTIPLEAGIENRAISLTKGCYVGQEVIIRVLHRGHGRVARKLAMLEVTGDVVPVRGATILAGEQEIGRITSAVFSPKRNGPLALGFVQRDYLAPGTQVMVRSAGEILQATVRQLGQ